MAGTLAKLILLAASKMQGERISALFELAGEPWMNEAIRPPMIHGRTKRDFQGPRRSSASTLHRSTWNFIKTHHFVPKMETIFE